MGRFFADVRLELGSGSVLPPKVKAFADCAEEQSASSLHVRSWRPMKETAYRSEALTIAGFVQQLAVQYIAHGYYF